jgi:hypothetical protein
MSTVTELSWQARTNIRIKFCRVLYLPDEVFNDSDEVKSRIVRKGILVYQNQNVTS